MGEPVAGGVLVTTDLKKILLVRNKMLGTGWTLPKGKIIDIDATAKDPCEAAAIRNVFDQTGISMAPRLSKAKKWSMTIDRFTIRQPQTLYILPIEEQETPKDKDAAWKLISTLPHLENIGSKQPPLNKKAAPEYENVAVFFKKLVDPLTQMAQNVEAGRAPEGPAVELSDTPPPVLVYAKQREKMLNTYQFEPRWKSLGQVAPTAAPMDASFVAKRNAVRNRLYAELSKVNVMKPIAV
eukprot:TRINITY_DN1366_c0_g1_i1.p1 TRINITY_DN1366_c0_g1~~TRINITY_DN1366_c0_g1_i1.p1  ORF type:complete len:239 (+),score=67.58 TRINITY_DN1366_c0_g1_i1:99-815(+)